MYTQTTLFDDIQIIQHNTKKKTRKKILNPDIPPLERAERSEILRALIIFLSNSGDLQDAKRLGVRILMLTWMMRIGKVAEFPECKIAKKLGMTKSGVSWYVNDLRDELALLGCTILNGGQHTDEARESASERELRKSLDNDAIMHGNQFDGD